MAKTCVYTILTAKSHRVEIDTEILYSLLLYIGLMNTVNTPAHRAIGIMMCHYTIGDIVESSRRHLGGVQTTNLDIDDVFIIVSMIIFIIVFMILFMVAFMILFMILFMVVFMIVFMIRIITVFMIVFVVVFMVVFMIILLIVFMAGIITVFIACSVTLLSLLSL